MSVDRRSFLRSTVAGIAAIPAVRPTVSATAATLAPGDEDPLGVRDEFPITKTHAFLNNCAIAPLCRSGRDAAVAYLDEKLLDPFPEPDPKALLRLRERKESVRRKFAGLFGVSPREVGLVQSTSAGENIVARGLKLKAGDNVVIDDLHFETSFLLYRELEKELGIELRVVPHRNGASHLADFDAACNARTRLVSVSWVSNRNGYRQNLKGLAEIAHARGAYLYADAIQAIGVFDTNVKDEGVDFLTCGGYKWLYANFGVAPFYVREELLDRIPSDRFGHLQVIGGTPEHDYQLQTTAAKYRVRRGGLHLGGATRRVTGPHRSGRPGPHRGPGGRSGSRGLARSCGPRLHAVHAEGQRLADRHGPPRPGRCRSEEALCQREHRRPVQGERRVPQAGRRLLQQSRGDPAFPWGHGRGRLGPP